MLHNHSGGLPRPYIRVYPPLLFGTVGILVYSRGILEDVATLRRHAPFRKASRKPAYANTSTSTYLVSDFLEILRGNRHCIH
ncbi:hypothetical protein EAG_15049 [Camponotus floridanus]|uniref:Uncharacterized protein n=1 Tax=Camponotus floridanus TaxID=104421 RepID=E2AZU4_CAMFO|nr:hypothetical protein EAG_15049 [Camponotus floridanus]